MPFSTQQLRHALRSKLGFEEDVSRRHPTFVRRYGTQVVGLTHLSHGAGRRDVSQGVLSAMARQLGVTGPQFRQAIDCTLDTDAFLQLLVQGGGQSPS